MLRKKLSFLLVCLTLSSFSQTYFYARAINVDPTTPSTLDNISLDVFGDLSATSSLVQNSSFVVNGFEIDLTLDCGTSGVGAPVLTPHTETVVLGSLPAGNYHVNLWGTGLGDYVMDTTDYYFIVLGPQAIGDIAPTSPSYDLFIDADSGLIQITQGELGTGIELIQLIDMQGKVILEQKTAHEKLVQVKMPAGKRGIFLVSVKSGDEVWSDIFSLPK